MVGGNRDRLLETAARLADIVQFTGFTARPGGDDYGSSTCFDRVVRRCSALASTTF